MGVGGGCGGDGRKQVNQARNHTTNHCSINQGRNIYMLGEKQVCYETIESRTSVVVSKFRQDLTLDQTITLTQDKPLP